MRVIIGVLCTSLWLLYAGQVVSALNYKLAVRLRLQDSGGDPNDVTHRLERWTALGLREQGAWTGTPSDWFATKVIRLPVIVLSGVAIAMGLSESI